MLQFGTICIFTQPNSKSTERNSCNPRQKNAKCRKSSKKNVKMYLSNNALIMYECCIIHNFFTFFVSGQVMLSCDTVAHSGFGLRGKK